MAHLREKSTGDNTSVWHANKMSVTSNSNPKRVIDRAVTLSKSRQTIPGDVWTANPLRKPLEGSPTFTANRARFHKGLRVTDSPEASEDDLNLDASKLFHFGEKVEESEDTLNNNSSSSATTTNSIDSPNSNTALPSAHQRRPSRLLTSIKTDAENFSPKEPTIPATVLESLSEEEPVTSTSSVTEISPHYHNVDIEDLFPCGKSSCNTFIPHLWKPNTCRTCFKSRRNNNMSHPIGEAFGLVPIGTFQEWERNHRPQCDLLKEHMLALPIVENVMMKNVVFHSEDQHEVVLHVVLTDNYESYEPKYIETDAGKVPWTPLLEEQLQFEEQLQKREELLSQREVKIKSERRKLLLQEKELILYEKRLFEKEKQLLLGEIEVSKREKLALHEKKQWVELKERESLKSQLQHAELEKLQQELEKAHAEIGKKENLLEAQRIKLTEETNNLKQMSENQWKRDQDLVLKEEEIVKQEKQEEENQTKHALESNNRKMKLSQAGGRAPVSPRTPVGPGARKEEKVKQKLESLISEQPNWVVYSSDGTKEEIPEKVDEILHLDWPENDIFYYRDNFMKEPQIYEEIETATRYLRLGKFLQKVEPWYFHDHINMLITHENDHIVVSLRKEPDENGNYLGIIRSKLGDQPFVLTDIKRTKDQTKQLLTVFRRKFTEFRDVKLYVIEVRRDKDKSSQETLSGEGRRTKFLPEDLLELDRKLKVRSYKIAVIYVKNGQTDASQVFSNDAGSDVFYQFMDFLGEKIKVKGWKGYRADLDVKGISTGAYSYYTEWCGLEIMFHVAPLLDVHCRQRVIGNDVVAIVFLESDYNTLWNPQIVTSQVLHGQIIVQPIFSGDSPVPKFRVCTVVREGVPRPRHTTSQLFELNENFRDFLLKQSVNTERAAWHCPNTIRTQSRSLQEHLWMTRNGQLAFLVEKHLETAKEY